MQKIINKLIKEFTKGVDTYTHNGSTWLIFTETKQWAIELTEDKTLWYNYNFFKGMFSIASMDVVESQHYITQWVEDNIINKIEHTSQSLPRQCSSVDDIIENGVKKTSYNVRMFQSMKVEDAIKNGVKETHKQHWELLPIIDYTIKNGVKRTEDNPFDFKEIIENVIDNGVKETIDLEMDDEIVVGDIIENGVRVISPMTQYADWQVEEIIENGINKTKQCLQHVSEIENVIDNGVKETHSVSKNLFWEIGDTLQNGVKETRLEQNITEGEVEEIIEKGVKETKTMDEWVNSPRIVGEVIDNGIKKVQPLPDQSGRLIGYGNYYRSKENRTKGFIDYLEETIKFGVKKSEKIS
jgi:hypothetical protein